MIIVRCAAGTLLALLAVVAGSVEQGYGAVLLVPEAYVTIQSAVDAAASADTISVAPGTYSGAGNRDIQIIDKALLIQSRSGPEQTIIDCQHLGRAFFLDGSNWYTLTIDGFSMINGEEEFGGAVRAILVHPVFRRCIFASNRGFFGGALYLITSSTLEDCRFVGNEDTWNGGGAVWTGVGSTKFQNCVFTGNSTAGTGGAVRSDGATLTFIGCTISANRCGEYGGGIFAFDCNVTLTRCICYGNCGPAASEDIHIASLSRELALHCSDVNLSGVTANHLVLDQVIDADPLFCDPRNCDYPTTDGSYTLESSSPCLPDENPCGVLIGALGIGCPVEGVDDRAQRGPGIRLSPGRPNPATGVVAWEVMSPAPGGVDLTVIGVDGRTRRSWPGRDLPAGVTAIVWDGRDDHGELVPGGRYYLVLRDGTGRVSANGISMIR